MAALNVNCPNCGLVIANAVITEQNTIQCRACKGTFNVKIRASTRMNVPPPPEAAARDDQDREETAPGAEAPETDVSNDETKSYSKAQMAALVYDRPARVPLGPQPEAPSYKWLTHAGRAALALAALCAIGSLGSAMQVSKAAPPDSAEWPLLSALLSSAALLCAAVLPLLAVSRVRRIDDQAGWIAWRGAALETPPGSAPGSALPQMILFGAAGLTLLVFGLRMGAVRDENGVEIFSGGAPRVLAFSGWVMLMGLASREMASFLWRMSQFGRSLPHRKRGDELSLGYPIRGHGAPEQARSLFLIVVALAFLLAIYATVACLLFSQLNEVRRLRFGMGPPVEAGFTALNLAGLALGGLLALAAGAWAVLRLAGLSGEVFQHWQIASRSIRKTRPPFFGARFSKAFKALCWALSACNVMAMIPVIKNVASTSVYVMLLSICIPVFTMLFVSWLGALKNDSFHFVTATSVFSPSKAPHKAMRLIIFAAVFVLLATLNGGWMLGQSIQFVCKLWAATGNLTDPATAKEISVRLLTGVVLFSLHVIPACWAALMLLDLDRAAANLEACEETRESRPSASSQRYLLESR
jgi:hypothetical protein